MKEKLKKKINVGVLSVRNTKKNLPNCAQKGNKGITLVALIITIIVLLILAVVAIRAVQGDGIISKAKEAQTKYEQEQAKEQAMLENYLGTIEGNIPGGSAPAIKRNGVIPEGGTYKIKNGATLSKGDNFPSTPTTGDTYEEGDYIYRYNMFYVNPMDEWFTDDSQNGWGIKVKNITQTEYDEILSEIAEKPMTNMYFAFDNCTSLTTAPTIPDSVTNMYYSFNACTSLTTAPTIPDSVTNMYYSFNACTSLTTAPTIPDSVTNMDSTFSGCTSLAGTIEINANPRVYGNTLKSTQITGITGSCSQETKDALMATK